MSGRDLLYKPQVPAVLPEEEDAKKKAAAAREVLAKRVGLQGARAREIASEPGGTMPMPPVVKTPASRELDGVGAAQVATQAAAAATALQRTGAFRNPYFTADVAAVHQINQRQGDMRALRGTQDTTDLKKVILPMSPAGIATADPGRLGLASDLMGLVADEPLDLQSLVSRHSAWLRDPKMTVAMIEERRARLEWMVAARQAALQRMAQLQAEEIMQSATVRQAIVADGKALDAAADLLHESRVLIGDVQGRADGMHARMAKTLGIKKGLSK